MELNLLYNNSISFCLGEIESWEIVHFNDNGDVHISLIVEPKNELHWQILIYAGVIRTLVNHNLWRYTPRPKVTISFNDLTFEDCMLETVAINTISWPPDKTINMYFIMESRNE